MNRFLLLALTAVLLSPIAANAFWGKYNSKLEARRACDDWAKKAGQFTVVDQEKLDSLVEPHDPKNGPPNGQKYGSAHSYRQAEYKRYLYERDVAGATKEINLRFCQFEQETRQYLGFSEGRYKANKIYSPNESSKRFDRRIVKYFRF